MPFHAIHPEPLLLLLALPLIWAVAWKSLTVEPGARKWAVFCVRSLVLLLLAVALADLRFADIADRLSVVFLLDHSASIPGEERDRSLDRVRRMVAGMKEGDRAGLVVFGRNASIESMPEEKLPVDRISSVIQSDYTDIGNAIRLSTASFPKGTQKRIVLVSDGNENIGSAVDEAGRAWASGTSVDALPVTYSYGAEVQVERIVLPSRVRKGEAFEVRLIINSARETTARIFITLDKALMNSPAPVTLTKGKNVLVHSMSLDEPGFYSFAGRVEADDDSVPGNNLGCGFTIVEGDPRILCIGDAEDVRFLKAAVDAHGIPCTAVLPAAAPASAAGFQSFDCIFLCNVPSAILSKNQMEALCSGVLNFGLGLVMVGGDKGFGAGGWNKTPVEDVLPVSCEIKQKKVLPNGALVLVMHTCEFAEGNYWTKRICKKAVERLTPEDLIGVISFNSFGGGCDWLFEEKLLPAADKEAISRKIDSINPGDMPDFDSALKMAFKELKEAKAAKKHIVVISDGDPSPPSQMLLRGLSSTSIAVSTVLIGPHGDDQTARRVMAELAEQTGGRFYEASDPKELPEIVTTVAKVVSANFIKEEEFTPIPGSSSEVMKGIDGSTLPSLHGRVVTSAKPGAEIPLVTPDGDPLLAHWRAGLGRTAAFTSDAKNRWASKWVPWAGFGKFWSQVARWCMRTLSRNNFNLASSISGRKGVVVLDAVDSAGGFINGLNVKAKAVSPSYKEIPVSMAQKGPGRYEGTFDADEVGSYFISLSYDGSGVQAGFMSSGASNSYPPEYKDLSANAAMLAAIASAGGGRVLSEEDDVFLHNLPKSAGMEPKWHYFLIAAMALFFADVFARRVSIPYGRIAAAAASAAGRIRAAVLRKPDAPAPAAAMDALLRRKSEVSSGLSETAPPPPIDLHGALPEARVDLDSGAAPRETPRTAPGAAPAPQADQADAAYIKRLLDAKKKAFEKKGREDE